MADPERQSLINKDDGNGYNSVDAVDEGADNPGSNSSVATNEDGAYRYCKAGHSTRIQSAGWATHWKPNKCAGAPLIRIQRRDSELSARRLIWHFHTSPN